MIHILDISVNNLSTYIAILLYLLILFKNLIKTTILYNPIRFHYKIK